MSADLWAAFGDGKPTDNPWTGQQNEATSTATTTASTSTNLPANQRRNAHIDSFDPWASFEGGSSKSPTPVRDSAAAGVTAIDDEWSAFENADAPIDTNVVAAKLPRAGQISADNDDEWSAFETHDTTPAGQTRLDKNTFDDAGVMWNADEALDDATDPFSSSNKATISSLIDVSGLNISEQERGNYGDDEDDFGDFEQAESTPTSQPTTIPRNMLASAAQPSSTVPSTIMQNRIETRGAGANSLIFGAVHKGGTTKPRSQQTATINQSAARAAPNRSRAISEADKLKPLPLKPTSKKELPKSPNPPTPVVKDEADDEFFGDWDDFTTEPPEQLPIASSKKLNGTASQGLPTDLAHDNSSSKADSSALPPSNVPPPSILLSYLAAASIPSLYAPSSKKSPNVTLRTAAHILAGRKQRWKRDTHLAQSMSISAAGPGLKSGMKLTGVDRAEATREDREAAELLRVFRSKAGPLRAAASRAGEKGVAELRDGAPVRVDKGDGGAGVTGTVTTTMGKPCVVCGLRRAERVAGVDAEVFDGFGEWWVEHWGHKECKEWWETEESALRGR